MKLVNPPFKLAEETLDVILALGENQVKIDKSKVIKATGKTEAYVKTAINFLIQLKIISLDGVHIGYVHKQNLEEKKSVCEIIKSALVQFDPYKDFRLQVQGGKTEKATLKLIKAVHEIGNELSDLKSIFDAYTKYSKDLVVSIPNNNNNIKKEHILKNESTSQSPFIHPLRIESLQQSTNSKFDTSRLIQVCKELNHAYEAKNYITVGVLIRIILDHVPPIFNKKTFTEIANNSPKSFKDVMLNLEGFHRKIADGFLHTQIRSKEYLPTETTVDCRSAIDVLLAEVINQLN